MALQIPLLASSGIPIYMGLNDRAQDILYMFQTCLQKMVFKTPLQRPVTPTILNVLLV
jgi:hypothetical protein